MSVAFLLSYYIFGLCCFIGMQVAYPGRFVVYHVLEWILIPMVLPMFFLFFFPDCLIPIAYFVSFAVFYYYCYYRKREVKTENVV